MVFDVKGLSRVHEGMANASFEHGLLRIETPKKRIIGENAKRTAMN